MNAKRLKELRCNLDLTQADLASRLHLSPSAIQMYERSEREPKNRTLVEMAALFHVTTDYLLGCSDNAFGTYSVENVPMVAEALEITSIVNRLTQIEKRIAKLEEGHTEEQSEGMKSGVDHEYIAARRKELELTQAEMAARLGMTGASDYCKYETGRYKWNADDIPALAEALECQIEHLFRVR